MGLETVRPGATELRWRALRAPSSARAWVASRVLCGALGALASLGGWGAPAVATVCANPPLTPPATGVCTATTGDAGILVRGTVLVPGDVLVGGHLLIDPAGTIVCVACDCSAAPGFSTATRVDCAEGVIAPGLVNALEFLSFDHDPPVPFTDERYEHRHDWRLGQNGHTQLPSPPAGSNANRDWSELRHVLAGTTSILGSTGRPGLARNLDGPTLLEGLSAPAFDRDNFPFGDAATGTRLVGSCAYPALPAPASGGPYAPIVAEGIDASAENELLCATGAQPGGVDVLAGALVGHAVAVVGGDAAALAARGAAVVWTPRNDLQLYGATAPVAMLERAGVPVALGSTWTPTGSLNLQRELACADRFDRRYLVGRLSDRALVEAVTSIAASAGGMDGEIGRLATGLWADVVVLGGHGRDPYRAVIEAEAPDVALVLRGGLALAGEPPLLDALGAVAPGCDADLDVCGHAVRICVVREVGVTYASLASLNAASYPLFFCSAPADEPLCEPRREIATFGTATYTGERTASDFDGDGFANGVDLCPLVFDPPLVTADVQEDADGDGAGDACDFCPTSASAVGCGETGVAELSISLAAPATRLEESRLGLTLVVSNAGPQPAETRVVAPMLRELADVSWTCTVSAGSSCPAGGEGALDAVATLVAGGSAQFHVVARVPRLDSLESATFVHSAAVLPAQGLGDGSPLDNYAGAATTVVAYDGTFADGFESGDTLAWSYQTP
jgi:large repetitive protein